ncbi:hypothetical protein [Rhodococcoides fascians]|uniref:hypothetical protein n=1 Tax=Rhodococcoides fascians TaxID=1828 RepID=UPI00277E1D88|nr:hypothetical protein [Rhodococcus fascians]MDQ0283744.1 hypothetical protein [Rhodococcus fascians]
MTASLPDRIEQIRRKLRRAGRFYDELEREVSAYDTDPDRLVVLSPPRAPGQFLPPAILNIRKPPDPEWEVTLGIISGLVRSALDQIVAAAVVHGGGSAAAHRGGFPIYADSAQYAQNRNKSLRGVDESIRIEIDSHQPFTAHDPQSHPLRILNALCNGDKHRDGHPVLTLSRGTALTVRSPLRQEIRLFATDFEAAEADKGHAPVLTDGTDLSTIVPESAIESIAWQLEMEGWLDEGGLIVSVHLVAGICFGTEMVRLPQLKESMAYVEQVIETIASRLT